MSGPWYGEPKVTASRLERLRKVADLWNKGGLGVRDTARRLEVNPSTISRDRKFLIEMWQQTVNAEIGEIAARELAKLDQQEAELWLAWERSKHDKERTTNQEKRGALPIPVGDDEEAREIPLGVTERTTTRTTEGRLPDARYMDLIIEVGKRRERILGLDKGIKIEVDFDWREAVRYASERRKARRPAAEKAIERDSDAD